MTDVTRLRRMLGMDWREIHFRARLLGRREAQHVSYLTRRPQWRRETLARALRQDDPDLDPVLRALDRHDWMTAHRSFVAHMAHRRRRFVLDPRDRLTRADLVRANHPDATANAARVGEQLRTGQFDLLGYRGLSFESATTPGGIDWHLDPVHQLRVEQGHWSRVRYLDASNGDHKIVWELNRHQAWLALGRAYWLTGDERYRNAFIAYLNGWMANNPPLSGVNWASMLELALRAISWVWALHLFAVEPSEPTSDVSTPWTLDLMLGLHRQLTMVEQNLSQYFSPNTHLLGEALGLYVVGRALPELRGARRWESLGRRVLLEQSTRQVHDDGGHVELSTHYHRYALDFYLLALTVARETFDPHAPRFAETVGRLANCARTLADDNGRLPMLGDDDGGSLFPICGRAVADIGDSLQLSAQLLNRPTLAVGPPAEEVIWMTGVPSDAPGRAAPWPSTALPAMGYLVSRSRRGDHLTFDAGRHGFLNGGHAHADALALTLSVRGRPLFIDPGTGCYTVSPELRDRFRSTQYHNTLTIDGRSQSIPNGPFHWHSVAHARAHQWHSKDESDFFEGAHDAYAPVIHNRAISIRPGCWCVVDSVLGLGTHLAEAHWHLDPAWHAERTAPGVVQIDHEDGGTIWMFAPGNDCEVLHGSEREDLGWCAPIYGSLLPTSTIRVARRATAPFTIVTILVESAGQPCIAPMPTDDVPEGSIGFSLESDSGGQRILLTPRAAGDASSGDAALWNPGVFEPTILASGPSTGRGAPAEEGVV